MFLPRPLKKGSKKIQGLNNFGLGETNFVLSIFEWYETTH